MPGGKVEIGEDPISAVQREIVEEAGVRAKITGFIGAYAAPYRDDLVLLFKGHVEDRLDWVPNDEISELGFFSLTDLPEPMAPNPRLRFEHVASGLQGVFWTFEAPGVGSQI